MIDDATDEPTGVVTVPANLENLNDVHTTYIKDIVFVFVLYMFANLINFTYNSNIFFNFDSYKFLKN